MSLRALKKQHQIPAHSYTATTRQNLYRKSSHHQQQQQQRKQIIEQQQQRVSVSSTALHVRFASDLQLQTHLLGRAYFSNPEIRRVERTVNHLRTKSENDISILLQSDSTHARELVGAKSEICLKTITSHNYHEAANHRHSNLGQKQASTAKSAKMISGARSHRDLSNSTYGARTKSVSPIQPRRLSESSLNSTYSQRTSAMSSSSYGESGTQSLSVGIRGYEVIEERARFTVYKLRVENPLTNDCWLVLRRYTDFVRLNNKLKQAFPHITLMLPRKKIFGDNFNSVFLDNRVQGLQIFVNNVMARDELRKYKIVREFFCLDEPPSYSESMEECRAIFEAQEETIAHLKMQIGTKNDLILNLQQKLRDELMEKEQLKEVIKDLSSKVYENCDLKTSNVTADHNDEI